MVIVWWNSPNFRLRLHAWKKKLSKNAKNTRLVKVRKSFTSKARTHLHRSRCCCDSQTLGLVLFPWGFFFFLVQLLWTDLKIEIMRKMIKKKGGNGITTDWRVSKNAITVYETEHVHMVHVRNLIFFIGC